MQSNPPNMLFCHDISSNSLTQSFSLEELNELKFTSHINNEVNINFLISKLQNPSIKITISKLLEIKEIVIKQVTRLEKNLNELRLQSAEKIIVDQYEAKAVKWQFFLHKVKTKTKKQLIQQLQLEICEHEDIKDTIDRKILEIKQDIQNIKTSGKLRNEKFIRFHQERLQKTFMLLQMVSQDAVQKLQQGLRLLGIPINEDISKLLELLEIQQKSLNSILKCYSHRKLSETEQRQKAHFKHLNSMVPELIKICQDLLKQNLSQALLSQSAIPKVQQVNEVEQEFIRDYFQQDNDSDIVKKRIQDKFASFIKQFSGKPLIGKSKNKNLITLEEFMQQGNSLEKVAELCFDNMELNKIPKQLIHMPKITYLKLKSNKISKIQHLDNLIKLRQLSLGDNRIKYINNLSKLKNLQDLSLNQNEIETIQNLDECTKLRNLFLHTNKIKKMQNLTSLINIETLSLAINQIVKIQGLQRLKSLEILNLHSNQITKIQNLDNLVNLRDLSLAVNKIKKIQNLHKLKNLKNLSLDKNQLTKIEGLQNLVNLEDLSLGDNKITKIQNLQNQRKVQRIYLNNNYIEKIENLDSLQRLLLLSLQSNQIRKIQNLQNLQRLEVLSLHINKITQLTKINNLTKLKEFYITFNPLHRTHEGVQCINQLKQKNVIVQIDEWK